MAWPSRRPIRSSATPGWGKWPWPRPRPAPATRRSARPPRSATIAPGPRRFRAAAAGPLGGQGGGTQPDFDALIDLITSTVAPTTWEDVGGPGSISPFPTGVWVDAQGVLRPLLKEEKAGESGRPARRQRTAPRRQRRPAHSPLRMISLTRLEKQVQLRLAAGRQPSEAMQVLAGLQRIQYVFLYPESGDLVLAGPAGDWTPGPEGILVSADTGQPVVRLDDLVVVFRHMMSGPTPRSAA